MRLAEALAERKDALARIKEFPTKLVAVATWDEDERKPDASAVEGLRESHNSDLSRVQSLNVKIHEANNALLVDTEVGNMSLMAAIALRDRWNLERIQVERAASEIEEALGRHDYRYSRRSKDDVKTSSLISARDLKRETDELAGKIRRLDLAIQMVNWSQDLPE